MNQLGIGDCSDNDTFPTTDWKKAFSMGVRFSIVKATTTGAWVNGKPTLRKDSRYDANIAGMGAQAIDILPYCWFDPRPQITSQEQADFYCSTIGVNLSMVKNPVADVENSGNVAVYKADSVIRLQNWLLSVEKTLKLKPAIYISPSTIDRLSLMADISFMGQYPLIVACWDVLVPRIPWPWFPGGYTIWQYTANMLGSRYGFYAMDKYHNSPKICMAVREA